MKSMLMLACLVVVARAYQVYEDLEDDETVRGKRQEAGGAYIDSIFNIPISAIKQTSVAAQTLSPANAATIDSVLKIPVTTLQAVSALIKNRQQSTTTTSQPIRREDTEELLRDDLKSQQERQRVWEEQVHKRRMDQMQRYNRRMQQKIRDEDAKRNFHKDSYGFSSLGKKWTSHRVESLHAGHGDGHVYQYYNRDRPMFFGGQREDQGTQQPSSTKPTPTTTTVATPSHVYAVQEVVDEGKNRFAWPDWFGVIRVLEKDDFKLKYRKQQEQASEREVTGNELDAEVDNSREGRDLFP